MKAGKHEKKQVELVNAWNIAHQPGLDRSEAFMLGSSGDYPGHTAMIQLEGISGCYSLDRVRPA